MMILFFSFQIFVTLLDPFSLLARVQYWAALVITDTNDLFSLSFFFQLFWCEPFKKLLWNLLQYCVSVMPNTAPYALCLFFWPWGMWNLTSLAMDFSCTSCVGRQSFNHCTIREVPFFQFNWDIVDIHHCLKYTYMYWFDLYIL